jgi:transcription initiation factor IIE alpha subunit
MKHTYTTIIHSVRKELGLSLTEYVVCDTIDRLSNRKNNLWCTLTNKEIAEDLGHDERTIRRAIDKLKTIGLVEVSRNKKRTTAAWYGLFQADKMSTSDDSNRTKCPIETDKMSAEPDKMSALYNNNIYKQSDDTEEQFTLPQNLGSVPTKRLSTLYAKILRFKMGSDPIINWGKLGRIFSTQLKTLPEHIIAVLLIAHFNYNPENGDKFLAKLLHERMYPIELFVTNINTYKTYLTQEKGIDFSDAEQLQEIISNYLQRL